MFNMKKELLFSVTKKDFVIEPYKGSGKGGQHRNKTMSCCRIRHPESGAVAQACEERDFHRNRKVAFRRLVQSDVFQLWRKKRATELMMNKRAFEQKIERMVDEAMRPDNLKVEVKDDNGNWMEEE
jgi:peptide chain release factor 1